MRLVKNVQGFPLKKIQNNKADESEVFVLPKGTWVLVDFFALHNCSANWKKPSEFNPERWLNKEKTEIDLDSIDEFDETKKDPVSNPLASVGAYAGIGTKKDDLIFAPFRSLSLLSSLSLSTSS